MSDESAQQSIKKEEKKMPANNKRVKIIQRIVWLITKNKFSL
jgi:hypothetical protein